VVIWLVVYGFIDLGLTRPNVRMCIDIYTPTQAPAPQRLLDVGCSAGISTRYLKQAFPGAKEVGGFVCVDIYRAWPDRLID
jgi:trans-aconitate methyltransferase